MKRGYHNFTPNPPHLPGPAESLPRAWECPRCRRINAWWLSSCRCKPAKTDVVELNSGGKPHFLGH